MDKKRCDWCGTDPLYMAYHDQEWGVPLYDDQKLFEFLILEGMQAGLSWLTILRKREGFREAFAGFDPYQLVKFTSKHQEKLLENKNIIRNKLKIASVITNAQAYLAIKEQGEFSEFIWQFVDGVPRQNHWQHMQEVPASTPESDLMARELKRHGFKFVGTTICYAYMQAIGMVNDHLVDCYRHQACSLA